MPTEQVTVDNFVRAETNRMFAGRVSLAGGVNIWQHTREPTPVDAQGVIRMNRDTLYSSAIVDISEGAFVTIPDPGERYLSMMVVNQDHYINRIFHEAGEYQLTVEEFDTPYVGVVVRILVDPRDPEDVAAVTALQDRLAVRATSARPFVMPEYELDSFDRTRAALLELATGGLGGDIPGFGRKHEVDPIHHLIGTAAGWGGLPPTEARYQGVYPNLPASGAYKLHMRAVPVDGFWSVSVYNADGFFQPNELDAYSVNSVTAEQNDDDSVTVHFGACQDGRVNCLPIMDGWNYTVRLYRPRREVTDGTWALPELEPG